MSHIARRYWDGIAAAYQRETRISCDDFHYGPLLPGDSRLRLLPESLAGLACLELGSGAAQNSVHLASREARCTALDISGDQLDHARRLAAAAGVRLDLVQGDLLAAPFHAAAAFDLIHSVFALPFVADPARVLRAAAALLRPGGTLLLSTAHPLSTAEWIELDAGETGVLLPDYFHPQPDSRSLDSGAQTVCRPAPVEEVFGWLLAAGLSVDRLLEPRPLPPPVGRPLTAPAPYSSDAWLEHQEELNRVPFALVLRAHKPVRG